MQELLCKNHNISKYHTYGITAHAKYFVEVSNEKQLQEALSFANEKEIPFLILGRGSNCLIKDDFFDGLVIANKMVDYNLDGNVLIAEGGVNLPLLARKMAKLNLSGLEHFVGIPGTVGGAIFMNAGAGKQWVGDFVEWVEVLLEDGTKKIFSKEECMFSYRKSTFHKQKGIILRAKFILQRDDNANACLKENLAKRLATQPIAEKNSGCIFKNPDGTSAGALIDKCGLKGLKQGGAIVSTKHANFINNKKEATFSDVMGLIEQIKEIVKKKEGIELECEVRII